MKKIFIFAMACCLLVGSDGAGLYRRAERKRRMGVLGRGNRESEHFKHP